jgi:hypothetical protein
MNTLFEDAPFDDPADPVGIGFMTPQAPRAYRIGGGFKKTGKKIEEKTDPLPRRLNFQFGLEGGVFLIVNFARRPNFLG